MLPANTEEQNHEAVVRKGRFPSWLHRKLPKGNALLQTSKIVSKNRLHTVCEEAKCPNLLECWSAKTATFLAMGKACTRNCGFCDIDFDKAPNPLDPKEPENIAESVKELGLKHVVITMVARDDRDDGGSHHLVKIIEAVKDQCPDVTIEVLTSDFQGKWEDIDRVIDAKPDIFNYNTETVRRLTPRVRHKATYVRTLELLSRVKERSNIFVKSGLMVGLGETEEEVFETLRDLKNVGCSIVTIGQYLQANIRKLLVKDFITPEQFLKYEQYGKSIGIQEMYCGPFVRSSYNAGQFFQKLSQEVHSG